MESQDSESSPRRTRSRERARARLLEAALRVLARRGVDAATIAEITQEADVGFGSFYNHFESKEAILDAVVDKLLESHGATLDSLTESFEDPAEALAASIRHTVGRVEQDPTWGEFVVRFGGVHRALRAGLGARARRDLRRGAKTGRFLAPDPAAALVTIGGGVLAVTRARLDGTLGSDAGNRLAESVLRMLGLPSAEAVAIAKRPLPPLKTNDPA
jgi:AcrR family transcriptional regulator